MRVVADMPAGAYMPMFDADAFVGNPVNEHRGGRRIGTITAAELHGSCVRVTMRIHGNSVFADEVRCGRMPGVVEWADDSNYFEAS